MKYIITENRINNLIERFILERYPMVKRVTFSTMSKGYTWGYNNDKVTSEENPIRKNVITVELISGKLTHSPSYTLKKIRNDINPMFGLDIGKRDSDWGIDYKNVLDESITLKQIIKENKLNDFMTQYLDSWLSTKHSYDFDQFIIIEDTIETHGGSAGIIMEHDNEDGRLWFDTDFRKNLIDLFNKSAEEINYFIKEWFEHKFGVEVKYVD
jgi:hypothetical protein